jgi:hypothetical protein
MGTAERPQSVFQAHLGMGDNQDVSVQQVAAEAQAVVDRARSLFGSSPEPVADKGSPLASAAGSVADAGQRTAGLTGQGIDEHHGFVAEGAPVLARAGQTDTTLVSQLSTAAAVTQSGARQLDAISAQTRTIAQAASAAHAPAAQRMIVQALRSQVAQVNTVVDATRQQAHDVASQIRALDYGSGGKVQAVGFGRGDAPLAPPPEDPPHGKDPRYWIDVTKVIHVPPGQLAPYGTRQIGPDLWYPSDDQQYDVTPPPPPAQYPLDVSKMTTLGPGALGPAGTTELAPGVFAPAPNSLNVEPPWPPPRQPVDIRDIIQVPKGQLAPYGYVEYLPGWWVPQYTNPPTIPQIPR